MTRRPFSPASRSGSTSRTHPDQSGTYDDNDEARKDTIANLDRLYALQEMMYGQRRKALQSVLQSMDIAGKDGTIKRVVGAFNPQGVQVHGFKVPSADELARD
ncbi:MAG TPA: hypothetical protein PKJ21_02915 [Anaerolineae bacterium]|nr:hypothetical protein [Anaerolineae bacterium]HNT05116.1 hypothetical protein [Anaerolineae bacterium]